jgi:hypothetical protein
MTEHQLTGQPVTTTYVAYQDSPAYDAADTVKPVTSRDPQQAAKQAHGSADRFFFYDVISVDVEANGQTLQLPSERLNVSKIYYIDPEVLDADAVKARPGDQANVLFAMRTNGWDRVVVSRNGYTDQFNPNWHEQVSSA